VTISSLAQPQDSVQVDLSGRTALVTGAGSGIGRSVALALGRSGAHVIAIDINEAQVSEVAEATGGEAVVADLSDLSGVDALDLKADILVNCAGIQHVRPVEEFDPEMYSKILRIMLEAPFRLIRNSLPGMYEKAWGRIINVSSVHGLRASKYKSAYVSAKHGLEGLSKVVALEAAAHGVTSNCINPGYVRTPLVDKQVADQAKAHGISENEVLEKVFLANAALKRLVEPEEIAQAALFLCTPAAASMTGTNVIIDGGGTAS
jgi:3-hydroxybutyrate dehydrogenase